MDARAETFQFTRTDRSARNNRLEQKVHAQSLTNVSHLRCFVDANCSRTAPYIDGIEYVFDAEDDFDLFVGPVGPSSAGDSFADFIARCGNPAAPMIALTGRHHPRADIVINDLSGASLAAAISSLQPLLKRTAALPPLPRGIDRNGLLALALMLTRDCSPTACWQPYFTMLVEYPLLRGIEGARAVLEEMADASLVRRRFFQRVHLCTNCGSSRLHAREVCISCHSSQLQEQPLVHHYSCAFQGPQPLFETADGYACPKCHKKLRHYGVDYDKPGSVISCTDCNAVLSEPEVGFTCVDCNFYTSGDQATHRDWYHYDLLPDGVAALRSGELPHAGTPRTHLRGHSVRDFGILCERLVAIAQQHDRPLSICRIQLDSASLAKRAGQRGFLEICRFVRDLLAENLRNGDVLSSLSSGVFLCCLPETDGRSAEAGCTRLRDIIARNLNVEVDLTTDVIARDDARAFVKGLADVR